MGFWWSDGEFWSKEVSRPLQLFESVRNPHHFPFPSLPFLTRDLASAVQFLHLVLDMRPLRENSSRLASCVVLLQVRTFYILL